MILTCPECATSYFVEDGRIPPQGRRVRCSSCGHRWTAGPDGSALAEQAAEAALDEPPAETVPADPAPIADEALDVAALDPPPLRPRRATPPPRRRSARSEARSSAMLWAGMAAVAAAVIAAAMVFRSDVVRIWPKSSAAYTGLGLTVDGGGLVIEQVRADPAFLGGRPVLSVTGAIRNLRDEDLNSPALRISLLNRDGKPVAAKIARPLDARIPGRSRRHFAVAILDPPANARDLEVRFEGASAKTAAHAQAVLTPAQPAPPPVAPTSIGALTEHG